MMNQSWVGQAIPRSWLSWTPTWANITVGNGTVTAKYIQIGKTVYFRLVFVLGSTSTVGTAPTFTLPVTAATHAGTTTIPPLGVARCFDNGSGSYFGSVYYATTTTAAIQVYNASSTYLFTAGITSTVPFTWTTTDEIGLQGFYEAA